MFATEVNKDTLASNISDVKNLHFHPIYVNKNTIVISFLSVLIKYNFIITSACMHELVNLE